MMRKKVYANIDSGMGNRILPLISAIRLAEGTDRDLYVFWSNKAMGRFVETKDVKRWAGRAHQYSDFFSNVEFTGVSHHEFNVAAKPSPKTKVFTNTSYTTAVVSKSDLERYDTLVFTKMWYPIAIEGDEWKPFIPYPVNTAPITDQNNYFQALRSYAHKMQWVQPIQEKVKEHAFPAGFKMIGGPYQEH